MTLRRRWTISILAILGLFGLNLAVFVWGNARRDEIVRDLKAALERKDLSVETRNRVADRQRDAEVMEPLVVSGAVVLTESQLGDMRQGIDSIAEDLSRLGALPGASSTDHLVSGFDRLSTAWLSLYEATGSSDYEVRYTELSDSLAALEEREAAAAQRAEENFAAVAELTDRVTLAIFSASSLLAAGIALWFSSFLRRAFARYVTAEVAASVLETKSGLELGGEKREITVLMADLRGFSGMTERLEAEQVVAVLNNFLGAMTEIIVEAGGTIDEFIGDAILVFFGAPTAREDHADRAVRCAVLMQRGMDEVNQRNSEDGLPEVEMGVGIHSGEVVVGNIGSEKRTKYGAVGSAVNLAGRIETHTVGGQILISGATRDLVNADLQIDRRLEMRPKGIDQTVTLLDVGGIYADDRGEVLDVPRREEEMQALSSPLPVRFSILEGKETGVERFDGTATELSTHAARIRSRIALEPLMNIRIELGETGATRAGATTYAKVVEAGAPSVGGFVLRFTAVTDDLSKSIERLLALDRSR